MRADAPLGLVGGHAPDEIPASHRDLAECPPVAALSTIGRDGYPQTSVVWCDVEGDRLRVNTMLGFAKERNMRRDPRLTILCFDPRQPSRYLEVRGRVVAAREEGAREQLDALAWKYRGQETFPVKPGQVRVMYFIQPLRVIAREG